MSDGCQLIPVTLEACAPLSSSRPRPSPNPWHPFPRPRCILLAERPDVTQTPQTSSHTSASGCGPDGDSAPDGADILPRAEGELSYPRLARRAVALRGIEECFPLASFDPPTLHVPVTVAPTGGPVAVERPGLAVRTTKGLDLRSRPFSFRTGDGLRKPLDQLTRSNLNRSVRFSHASAISLSSVVPLFAPKGSPDFLASPRREPSARGPRLSSVERSVERSRRWPPETADWLLEHHV
jgi:hypothetical protein